MRTLYQQDAARYPQKGIALKYLYHMRKASEGNKFMQLYHRFRLRCIRRHTHLEIPWNAKIGGGLYIGHPYNITINAGAVLGKNVNIHKGATIRQENRGSRKGTPVIGNCVWIGIHAVIVGNITIGDDVLIAPNAFVNCDVPSHSIVLGNPCIIKHRENATEGYINHRV